MKSSSLLPFTLLWVLTLQPTVAQNLAIQADYFLFVNLSGQPATDPTGLVKLGALSMSHTIDFTAPKVRIKTVAVDFSADKVHWTMRRSLPVSYQDPQTPDRGLCLEKITAEETDFFRLNNTLYVRLSFFDQKGVFAGEFVQKGIVIQNIVTGKAYKLEKGMQVWQGKNSR